LAKEPGVSVKPVTSSKESVPATDNETEFDSTLDVLERARKGDGSAARVLIERTVGPLRRWARGRLPYYARAGANTEDVVQDAVLRALARVDHFEHRSVDGMQKYLRESVRNRIRDEVRRVTRRGVGEELPDSLHDNSYSPLEELILKERSERYLAALRTLKPNDRMAIIFRLEQQLSFEEIAAKLGKSSPDAARMAVTRAVKRLGEAIGLTTRITPTDASDAGDRGGSGRARTGS
jgi:RNA polymerase sigma factor (sigma-70 family)